MFFKNSYNFQVYFFPLLLYLNYHIDLITYLKALWKFIVGKIDSFEKNRIDFRKRFVWDLAWNNLLGW